MKKEFEYLNDVVVDFSKYEETALTKKECQDMKQEMKKRTNKRISWKKCAAVAACAAAVAVFSQTAFAQNLMADILKSITTGHNTFIQVKDSDSKSAPVPEELKGKIFDKDGNPIQVMSSEIAHIYDKDGKEVRISAQMDEYNGSKPVYTLETVKNEADIPQDDKTCKIYTSIEEVQSILNFTLKTPQELPDGYYFLYARGYRAENNSDAMSGDYVDLIYSNGEKSFFMQERVINEETSFTESTSDDIQEIDLNGNKAVYSDRNIDWESDGIAIGISGKNAIFGEALLQLAKSVR